MNMMSFGESFIDEDIDTDEWWNRRLFLEGDTLDSDYDEWPTEVAPFSGYDYEDELIDHLAKLPPAVDVAELTSALRVSALREFSAEVVNGMVASIKRNDDRLEQARFINSWIATAEETVAAGRNYRRIAARRK